MNMDWSKTFESVANFAESLGGLRRSLIEQGFSDEAAEQIIIQVVCNQRQAE